MSSHLAQGPNTLLEALVENLQACDYTPGGAARPAAILWTDPQGQWRSLTETLLAAIPDLDMTGRRRIPVAGEVPSPINPPSGCSFHPRCPHAHDRCLAERPALIEIDGSHVACHAVEEGRI